MSQLQQKVYPLNVGTMKSGYHYIKQKTLASPTALYN